jgi:hypothetical protein
MDQPSAGPGSVGVPATGPPPGETVGTPLPDGAPAATATGAAMGAGAAGTGAAAGTTGTGGGARGAGGTIGGGASGTGGGASGTGGTAAGAATGAIPAASTAGAAHGIPGAAAPSTHLYPPVLSGSAAACGLRAITAAAAVRQSPAPTAALAVMLAKVVIPTRLPFVVRIITSMKIVSSATVELPEIGVYTSTQMVAGLTHE